MTSSGNKNFLYKYVVDILDSLQNLLDSVENYEYLPIILSIIQKISQSFPDIFDTKYEVSLILSNTFFMFNFNQHH